MFILIGGVIIQIFQIIHPDDTVGLTFVDGLLADPLDRLVIVLRDGQPDQRVCVIGLDFIVGCLIKGRGCSTSATPSWSFAGAAAPRPARR